ncbi:MAG: Crp/Fnr family transcriptional regulator [Crocinitomicaceae bacterium]|jgi:CRP/FNR family transcriptional regulator|tara:strand:- start:25836 stop:26507 length:672 start_codon:yes stop_codon:yes gene_type:complete
MVTCSHCLSEIEKILSGAHNAIVLDPHIHNKNSEYKKGEILFSEGGIPRGVFYIHSGLIKIIKSGNEGKEQIIEIAKTGDLVGFRAMLSDKTYNVDGVMLEDTSVCYIQKSDFMQEINLNEQLRNTVIRVLSKELQDRADLLTTMAQKTVRQRSALALILLDDIYKGNPINLSRDDLANYVGTATETVIRLLREFKKDGLVGIQGRKITILEMNRLIEISKLI